MSETNSSLSRMLAVLDLFTDTQFSWSAEEIASTLKVSVPTAYRYLKMLVDAGLLQRAGASQYRLGARIIVLDHYIRIADPILQISAPLMKDLVEQTGFDCVMSALYGDQIIDTHREYGQGPAPLSYGRGRPRPLLRGAAPKVILSGLAVPRLRRIFDQQQPEVAALELPTDWPSFRKYFAAIRRRGSYVSLGELESSLGAVAAPIQHPDGSVLGAIALVASLPRFTLADLDKLTHLVRLAAQDINTRVR